MSEDHIGINSSNSKNPIYRNIINPENNIESESKEISIIKIF